LKKENDVKPPSPLKVLYFTIVPLGNVGNGGSICCSNHIRRLSQEPGLEVSVLAFGLPNGRDETSAYLSSLGLRHQFVSLLPRKKKTRTLAGRIERFVENKIIHFPLTPWEILARQNPHVAQSLNQTLRDWNIDILVIDYNFSASFIPLPRADVKTCIIKLNREAEFYVQQLRQKSLWEVFRHGIKIARTGIIERHIDRSVDKVIVVGPPDLPKHRTRSAPICLTPYLDREPVRWRYSDSRSVFFVGSIGHYPNYEAIAWIATKLAPELAKLRLDIRIKIIGCTLEKTPEAWRKSGVEFLGAGSREDVERLFRESDLMLCPIENDFGMKFKAAEAIAFGTPLLASVQTLLGLPYLGGHPAIRLDRPREAAVLISELVGNEKKLVELSARQDQLHDAFVESQNSIWTRTLNEIGRPESR
jgi:glycosyltransferase involved in cell wall biosynthesis